MTFFAGSGDSTQEAVAGDGCLPTTPENCKVVQYPAEQSATGTIMGNMITIDVPIQGGFGANRPIFGTKLFNVTALSGGRNSIPYDFYADLDATKSFDYTFSGGGPPPPPPPEGGCNITGGGTIATGPGTEGRFSLNAHVSLKGKVQYRDGAAADFRSSRLTQVSCNASAHSGRIAGQGTSNGQMVTFTVDVVDNGESGSSDVFTITLRDNDNNVVYTRTGTLTSGNMQVH
jgi:ribosomal protein S8E